MDRKLCEEFTKFGNNQWTCKNAKDLTHFFTYNHLLKNIKEPVHMVAMSNNVRVPRQATPASAGFDIWMAPELVDTHLDLLPGSLMKVPTGIKMFIPRGYYGKLHCRSSIFTKGVQILEG